MLVLWPVYQLETEHNQYPGIMTMSAVLKQHGHESEVVPADYHALARRLGNGRRTILAFSTPSVHAEHHLRLNSALKRRFPKLISVFGGPHPTYFPQMIEEEGVDAICRGEGEYPMLELVSAVEQYQPIREIENWWVKEADAIYRNQTRPLIEDLDALPLPDHAAFWKEVPRPPRHALVLTSRGCPHGCTYCYNHAYRKLYEGKGRAVRRRSVDHVLQELRLLKRSGCRFIRFMDDLFILDEGWIGEFAERYRREIGLGFSCLVRPNYVTEEVVSHLKLAGCYRVMMGLEAGNDRIRRQVLKRNMSSGTIIEAARIIRGAGLKLVTANILAIPSGTFEDDWETLELNLRCRPSYASVSILQAYPGTEIHEYAHSLGMIDEDQMTRLSSAFGFSFESDLKFRDEDERRRIENLHKLFPWVVWMPWIAGLARRMVRMRPGRGFELLYLISVNIGVHLISLPPRIGLPILIRKFGAYLTPWRRRRPRGSGIPETDS